MRTLRITAIGLALAFGLIGAGCGDDQDREPASTATATAQPAELDITVSSTPAKPVFTMQESVPAGQVGITVLNDTPGDLEAELIRGTDGATAEEVRAALVEAGDGPADPFERVGELGPVEASGSKSLTEVLEPGTYYVIGGRGVPAELASFEVPGGSP